MSQKIIENAWCLVQEGKLIIAQEGTPVRKFTVWVLYSIEFENERVSQFVLIHFGDLIQHVCNSLTICGL